MDKDTESKSRRYKQWRRRRIRRKVQETKPNSDQGRTSVQLSTSDKNQRIACINSSIKERNFGKERGHSRISISRDTTQSLSMAVLADEGYEFNSSGDDNNGNNDDEKSNTMSTSSEETSWSKPPIHLQGCTTYDSKSAEEAIRPNKRPSSSLCPSNRTLSKAERANVNVERNDESASRKSRSSKYAACAVRTQNQHESSGEGFIAQSASSEETTWSQPPKLRPRKYSSSRNDQQTYASAEGRHTHLDPSDDATSMDCTHNHQRTNISQFSSMVVLVDHTNCDERSLLSDEEISLRESPSSRLPEKYAMEGLIHGIKSQHKDDHPWQRECDDGWDEKKCKTISTFDDAELSISSVAGLAEMPNGSSQTNVGRFPIVRTLRTSFDQCQSSTNSSLTSISVGGQMEKKSLSRTEKEDHDTLSSLHVLGPSSSFESISSNESMPKEPSNKAEMDFDSVKSNGWRERSFPERQHLVKNSNQNNSTKNVDKNDDTKMSTTSCQSYHTTKDDHGSVNSTRRKAGCSLLSNPSSIPSSPCLLQLSEEEKSCQTQYNQQHTGRWWNRTKRRYNAQQNNAVQNTTRIRTSSKCGTNEQGSVSTESTHHSTAMSSSTNMAMEKKSVSSQVEIAGEMKRCPSDRTDSSRIVDSEDNKAISIKVPNDLSTSTTATKRSTGSVEKKTNRKTLPTLPFRRTAKGDDDLWSSSEDSKDTSSIPAPQIKRRSVNNRRPRRAYDIETETTQKTRISKNIRNPNVRHEMQQKQKETTTTTREEKVWFHCKRPRRRHFLQTKLSFAVPNPESTVVSTST